MARGINKAILVGNLGNDPETRYTSAGMAITKVSLATTEQRKDKDGNKVENTSWHRVTFFGKIAEIAAEYLRKGSQVYVEGRISYSEHVGDDGQKRYYTDIVADELQMLGGRGEGGGSAGSGGTRGGAPQRQRPQQATQQQASDDFADDDIPFVTSRGAW